MKRPKFSETKATQLAVRLIQLADGSITYLKLMKLMYLCDRTALIKLGAPITFDTYILMKYGPVLNTTLALINAGHPPNELSHWDIYIEAVDAHNMRLRKEIIDQDFLSEAEHNIIESVFEKYGNLNQWELVKLLHDELPELINPDDLVLPIDYRDILVAENMAQAEIEGIEEELAEAAQIDAVFS
ncbi:hypothetical protein Pse7367_1119 [Thalassoporum mexicanum PCC 7367]|uniref:Panacea domain-containing protein n=1 Tax=Thalassoporum mexicanum TaxID=3457544 RepID=UPI00029FE5E2|nr:Panacea domain-containing protein [Pseudanabaena sp. PCC 7367]AFY69416.1 hypothetical protein Pse7367_1119 [Pseudanabaena sp. PCC 7367]